MNKTEETIYLHRGKEENLNLVEKYNNLDLKYLGYEITIKVEINNESNKHKILEINGVKIKEEVYI